MPSLRPYVTLLLICLSANAATAQQPHFYTHTPSLTDAVPTHLAQLSNGQIILAYPSGLFAYDGQSIRPVPVAASDTLLPSTITALGTQGDTLWAGYDDGTLRYLHQGQLWPFSPEEGTPAVAITAITTDIDGRLWFATYGEGLYLHNGRHLYNFNTDDGLGGNDLYALATDTDGNVWAGTDHGLYRCRYTQGRKHLTAIDTSVLAGMIVTALHLDTAQRLWIGTYEHGALRYDIRRKALLHLTPQWNAGTIAQLAPSPDGTLWLGTRRNGLWRRSPHYHDLAPIHETAGAKIYQTLIDQEGQLWVLSNKNGIQTTPAGLDFWPWTGDEIQAVAASTHGTLWVGTAKGLWRYDTGTGWQRTAITTNVISLYLDDWDNCWVGSFGEGLWRIAPNGRTQHYDLSDGLPNGSILDIEGQGTTLWIATLGGVVRSSLTAQGLQLPQSRLFTKADGLGASYVYDILLQADGTAWFGTDGQGITRYQNDQFTNYPMTRDSIPLKSVYSLASDDRGRIWFSTTKMGVWAFDGQRFEAYGQERGLASLNISGLSAKALPDGQGSIVTVIHPDGIDFIHTATGLIRHWGSRQGLAPLQTYINAYGTDATGQLWLGSATGVVRLQPMAAAQWQPQLQLQRVAVYLEAVDTSRHRFAHHERHFSFQYAGLWYTDPERVLYRYRLEGYDLDWNYTRDPVATYPNLPAGKYRFVVEASLGRDFSGASTVSYAFEVQAPFWQTGWFGALGVLLLGLAGWGVMRFREGRLQRKAAARQAQVQFELQTLRSQVNPHFLFNSFNTLLAILEESPPQAATYVEKLSDFYRAILQHQSQPLIALAEEVALLQDYAYLLQQRHGQQLRVQWEVHSPKGYGLPPLTLQLLLENAVKHNRITRQQALTITIQQEGNTVTIRNPKQPKIPDGHSTGFGLPSIERRYALLTERAVVIEDTMTHFAVTVPLLRYP